MKRKWVVAAVLLLASALAQAVCAMELTAINNSTPHSVELRGDIGVTMEQVAEPFELLRSSKIGVQSVELQASITVDGKTVDTRIVYATPKLGEILPLTPCSGVWMSGDGQAVLPEGVAKALFFDAAPEGKSIIIDGNSYSVTGVYDDKAIHTTFISDYSAVIPVASIFLADMRYAEGEPAELYLQRAVEFLGLPLNGELRDYRELTQLAQSLWYLSAVLCALTALILLLALASKLLYSAVFGKDELLRSRVFRVGLAGVLTAVPLICFALLLRGLNIPSAFLPPDNIFDIAFYRAEIASFFAKVQEHTYDARFAMRIVPLAAAGAVSVASFCASAVLIYGRIQSKVKAV